jgi:hypothetical protein
MRHYDDLFGKKFNFLTVISYYGNNGKNHGAWLWCKCDCGNEKQIRIDALLTGRTKSCGCYNKIAVRKKKYPIERTMLARLYGKYKWDAKKMGRSFHLTKQEFLEIITKNCFYCGIKPSNISTRYGPNDTYLYTGIDRVNNSVGYEIGNVVPCCKECNMAKHSMTQENFISWIDRVYHHLHKDDIEG